MKKPWIYILIVLVLSIPSFFLMLRFGIFSTQDFHLFRLVEFDKCVRDLQIPCRWAADSGAGFGEPIFNFYGQFPYWIGEIFHLISFSKIDSIKILFILSFVLSSISMFFLSKKIWKNDLSALISSTVYLYAPYRAVDVWVRGALPEAISFIFFPLIILFIDNYLEKRKRKDLLIFSLLLAIMIINHNLSIVLFAPFLVIWTIYKFIKTRNVRLFIELGIASVFSGLMAAFYLLPVIFESKYVKLYSTTGGIYNWRANFATINQLFISRFWGYGGSIDGKLSLSIGQIQWILPLVTLIIIIVSFRKKLRNLPNDQINFLVLFVIGLFGLFLTHNQSTFIWRTFDFMKYIQFPWRFLGISTFSFALASGLIIKGSGKYKWIILTGITVSAIAFNFIFFRPDIWYKVSDHDLETGPAWIEATFSSLPDYWPGYGMLPTNAAPTETKDVLLIDKKSNSQIFAVKTFGKDIEFPVAYFPGWELFSDGQSLKISPNKDGLIVANVPNGSRSFVNLKFVNTPIRKLGNIVSLVSFGLWILAYTKYGYGKESKSN